MKTSKILLLTIILVTFFLKLYHLSSPPLFNDEMDVGNQAYSLATTLKDYKGNFLPTYIQSFSESRAPFLMYLTLPFVKLFGLNYLSVRLPSVIISSLSLYFFFLLVKKISKKESLALLSVLILSSSPTFFHYSRLAFESSLLLLLILSASYYYLDKKYLTSFILFSLSFYTYNTSNLFVPLITLYLFVFSYKDISDKKSYVKKLILPLILLLPLLLQIIYGTATNRFSLISIFSKNHQATVEVKRSSSDNPYALQEKIFHNRPLEIITIFSKNYLTSFSTQNLFISGDPNPRHSVPGFGFFLLPLALLLPISLFSKHIINPLFLYWLLISPIAAALTLDGGLHSTRLFLMLPALAYFLATGADYLYQKSKILSLLLLLVTVFYFSSFLHELNNHYPKDQFESWGYGYQDIFTNLPDYNRFLISNTEYNLLTPHAFYQKIDPHYFQDPSFSDQPQDNILEDFTGYQSSPVSYLITNWNGDTLEQVKNKTHSGDLILLKQIKDIPGNMELSNFENFEIVKQVRDPYQNLLYQLILKK
jgi:4-amino-4-deoxy-L-arabinose transferase-like glycosyltransferase